MAIGLIAYRCLIFTGTKKPSSILAMKMDIHISFNH